MATIRVARRERYTVITRSTVNDDRLSFRARGVLAWLLDKPDDWHIEAEAIASHGTEGRDAVRTALRELEEFGYLVRTRIRTTEGRWRTSEQVLYETPQAENPPAGNQRRETSGGKPAAENQASLRRLKPKTETESSSSSSCHSRAPRADQDEEEDWAWLIARRRQTHRSPELPAIHQPAKWLARTVADVRAELAEQASAFIAEHPDATPAEIADHFLPEPVSMADVITRTMERLAHDAG